MRCRRSSIDKQACSAVVRSHATTRTSCRISAGAAPWRDRRSRRHQGRVLPRLRRAIALTSRSSISRIIPRGSRTSDGAEELEAQAIRRDANLLRDVLAQVPGEAPRAAGASPSGCARTSAPPRHRRRAHLSSTFSVPLLDLAVCRNRSADLLPRVVDVEGQRSCPHEPTPVSTDHGHRIRRRNGIGWHEDRRVSPSSASQARAVLDQRNDLGPRRSVS